MSRKNKLPFGTIPEWILYADISSHAVRVFAVLDRHDGLKHGAQPGRKRIAALTHASTDTVDRAIAELEAIGAVAVEPRPGKTSQYRIRREPPEGGRTLGTGADMGTGADIPLGTGADTTLGTGAERKRAREREPRERGTTLRRGPQAAHAAFSPNGQGNPNPSTDEEPDWDELDAWADELEAEA